MSTLPGTGPETVTTRITLGGPEWQLQARVTVPVRPIRPSALLPLAQSLADGVIAAGVRAAEAAGATVSCRKGCGACCRQLVPISEVEAHQLRAIVAELPEPRRTSVMSRFASARRQLQASGLVQALAHSESWDRDAFARLVADYFRQAIPCPFLEEEACSIHPDRPITCREYLVTSPAANCAQPTPETIRRVPLPLSVEGALARWNVPADAPFLERWVPLILAPEWADSHPDPTPPAPGLDVLGQMLELLSGKPGAAAPASAV